VRACVVHAIMLNQTVHAFLCAINNDNTQRMGALRMVWHIGTHEGVGGLFKGLSPALLRHVFYSPVRIVFYEQFR